MLALLLNLVIAAAAGLMFQLLWKGQYSGGSDGSSALRRAAGVALPPVISVYTVVVVITNISVSIQLAILLSVLAAVFTAHCLYPARPRLQSQRARPAVPALDSVGVDGDLGDIVDSHPAGDLPVAGPAESLAGPQPVAFLGNRFRRVGPQPGRGAGRVELGIHAARNLGLRVHVLCCRWQTYGVHLPN